MRFGKKQHVANFAFLSGQSTNNAAISPTALPFVTTMLIVDSVAHLNDLAFNRFLTADTTIQFAGDTTDALLNLSTLDTRGFNLNIVGTRQVLRTGGTLNAGTTTINPLAASGGQAQTAHTTDLATFAPFVIASLGGAAIDGCRITMTSGVDATDGAWIVLGVATADCSRPTTPGVAGGSLTIGDSYTISRGSHLGVAPSSAPVNSAGFQGQVTFTDFAFTATHFGFNGATYVRCSWQSALSAGGTLSDCFLGSDMTEILPMGVVNLSFGVLVTTGNGVLSSLLNVENDLYVTGNNPFSVGGGFYQDVGIFRGVFGNGIQCQAMQGNHGFEIYQGGSCLNDGLVWGNRNASFGVLVDAGATFAISGAIPSVTGGHGDFAFEFQDHPVTVARAWDDTAGAYTEAGAAATRACTWTNYVATLVGGGFNQNAHCVQAGSAIITDV